MGSEVSFAGGNSQSETHHTFCRSSCIYHIYSHKLRVLISHFFLLKNFSHVYNTKPDDKAQREMALCFLKLSKHWAKGVCQYIIRKKKNSFTHFIQHGKQKLCLYWLIFFKRISYFLKNHKQTKNTQSPPQSNSFHFHRSYLLFLFIRTAQKWLSQRSLPDIS